MNFTDSGLKLIKEFEGCAFHAYQDKAGVWTIGYGSTRGVCPGMTIDQAQADQRLLEDLHEAMTRVKEQIKVSLNDNQFSALVSFTFNEGAGHLQESLLEKLLNQGNFQGAADQFPRWDRVRGQEVAGLLRRRMAERTLFLTPLA
jgi:lysozyme